MRRLLLACLLVLAFPAIGQEVETAADLPRTRPQAFAAFSAVLPAAFADAPWAKALDGTSEQVRAVALEGKPFVLGFSCEPHRCGDEALAFLAALDGSRAVVMVRSAAFTGGRIEVYGPSSVPERTLLREQLLIPR